MAVIVPIDDPADERLADFAGLTDRDLRLLQAESGGRAGDFFIAEGAHVVRHLLRSRFPVRSLLVTQRGLKALEDDLAGVDAPAYVAPQALMRTICGFNFHRGAMASGGRVPDIGFSEMTAQADRLLVVEGVNDHENLGALFRNAAAFGTGGVLLDPTTADPLYRRCIRVSMGHALRVPFTRAPTWPGALADLRARGFEVLALTPAVDAEEVKAVSPRPRVALLVGAEGAGLSPAALRASDRRVRVPLAPGVDSLNVATAAAVVLHHHFITTSPNSRQGRANPF